MKAAGTMWKRRMADLAHHLTGRPATSVRLCAAKTLFDCSAVLRNLCKRKCDGGKAAWMKALDTIMKDAREAASVDLKNHMKQTDRKNPKPVRGTGHKDKQEEADPDHSENEKDREEASPEAAPYASSEGEPDGEPDGEPSDDEDVFKGDFAVPKGSGESALPKLPAKMQASLEKISREVLDTLPTDLSQADVGYWVACLEKEGLLEMNHFELGLEGCLSNHLGVGKPHFAKMSLRARKLFDSWAEKLPGVITRASACRQHSLCLHPETVSKACSLYQLRGTGTVVDTGPPHSCCEANHLSGRFPV
ncbi:unnamed protein product [Symbiodinium sp. CCMP2592]|nr:unnamed protein product [Symbiodinium sp. CCMP2592]CAE7646132.1 unnamed protein product [Symbiodinium sp. CCMP2592]CAE7689106.1 unnamed protein product [Symbiodinium sp. CCMP2592]